MPNLTSFNPNMPNPSSLNAPQLSPEDLQKLMMGFPPQSQGQNLTGAQVIQNSLSTGQNQNPATQQSVSQIGGNTVSPTVPLSSSMPKSVGITPTDTATASNNGGPNFIQRTLGIGQNIIGGLGKAISDANPFEAVGNTISAIDPNITNPNNSNSALNIIKSSLAMSPLGYGGFDTVSKLLGLGSIYPQQSVPAQTDQSGNPVQGQQGSQSQAYQVNSDGTIAANTTPVNPLPVSPGTQQVDTTQLQNNLSYWMQMRNQFAQAGLVNPRMAQMTAYAQDMISKTQNDIKTAQEINQNAAKVSTRFGNFENNDPITQEADSMAKATTTLEQLEYNINKAVKSGNLANAKQLTMLALDQIRPIEGVRPSGPQQEAFDNVFTQVQNAVQGGSENDVQAFNPANLNGTLSSIAALRSNTRNEFERVASIANASPQQRAIYLGRGNNVDQSRTVVADPQNPGQPLMVNGRLVEPSVISVSQQNGMPQFGYKGQPVSVTSVPVQWNPDQWIPNFESQVQSNKELTPNSIGALNSENDYSNMLNGSAQMQGTYNRLLGEARGVKKVAQTLRNDNSGNGQVTSGDNAPSTLPGTISVSPPTNRKSNINGFSYGSDGKTKIFK